MCNTYVYYTLGSETDDFMLFKINYTYYGIKKL